MFARLLLLAGPLAMTAPLAQADAGPAPRLVAGGDVFALVRGSAVQVFAADGRPLHRLGADEGDRRPRTAAPGAVRERMFDLLGVAEADRDTQAAEDLLEDEASLAERREMAPARARPADRQAPVLAAPAGGGLVVVAGGRLYRVDGTGPPVRLGLVPAGTTALAATGDPAPRIWIARGPELLASTGGAWRTMARGERPIDHLTGSPRGWLAWSSGDTLTIAVPAGSSSGPDPGGPARTFLAPARVRALTACGADLLILADDGLHVAADVVEASAGPARIAGPLPGERLACGDDRAGPWLVIGPGLLASADRGHTWRTRADTPAVPLDDALVAGDRVWLLARTGAVVALPLIEGPAAPVSTWADSAPAPVARRPSPWSMLLPRLVMTASHTQQGPRREQRLLAFAEFPLQGPPPPAPAPAAPAAIASPPLVFPGGADGRCLPFLRARAVERALADPARARSLVTRAGRSAWLPELRLRVERRLGRNESLDVRPASPGDALGLDTVDDVRYEVRATWDLPRIVFNPEEVAAHHQALRTAEMRRDVESLVNRLFFERRRLMLPLSAATTPTEHGERLLRLEELAAELDAVSGGAFSRCETAAEPASAP